MPETTGANEGSRLAISIDDSEVLRLSLDEV